MIAKRVVAISVLLPVAVFSISPMCNHTCIECGAWFPALRASSERLKSEYLSIEDDLSRRYNTDIIPLLDDRHQLFKQYDALQAEFEAINKLIALQAKKLKKEKERAK